MKQILALAIFMMLFACNGKRPKAPAFVRDGNNVDGNVVVKPGDLGTGGETTSLLGTNSSHLRFADSIALSAIYVRVFKKKDLGFEHCAAEEKSPQNLPAEASDCDNIFSRNERPEMGTFDIYASEFGRGPNNKSAVTSLKLGYLRTLRGMLLRECNSLVDKEKANLSNGRSAENIFIMREKPMASDIERYMLALLGIAGRNLSTGIDYEAYASALRASLTEAGNSEENVHKAWVNGCVAISMDPLIFLY